MSQGGCCAPFLSKKKKQTPNEKEQPAPTQEAKVDEAKESSSSSSSKPAATMSKPSVAIVYYSMYTHVYQMAEEVKKALEENGCEAKLYQVPETLPDEVLEKMHAPPKPEVEIATPDILKEADGIMFGLPTRFGMAAAQMKAFMDSTGSLWQAQALAGKPAGIFFSTATQNGGQETTALTFISQLVHHGMIFVPLGYATPLQFSLDAPQGGSPYGSGTLAGPDGSRQPSDNEKAIAAKHGEVFAKTVCKLTAGAAALSK